MQKDMVGLHVKKDAVRMRQCAVYTVAWAQRKYECACTRCCILKSYSKKMINYAQFIPICHYLSIHGLLTLAIFSIFPCLWSALECLTLL